MQSKRSLAAAAAMLTVTVLVLSAGSAQSQSLRLKADIPFAFYAGETQLPAGTYELERAGSDVYKIFNRGENSVFFGTIGVTDLSAQQSGKLIFQRYGNDYILSEMWWPGQSNGRKALPTGIEREAAANAAPVSVQIAAR